jgi:hypothetical protein
VIAGGDYKRNAGPLPNAIAVGDELGARPKKMKKKKGNSSQKIVLYLTYDYN